MKTKLLFIAGLVSFLIMACQSEELVNTIVPQDKDVVEFTDAELVTLFQMRGNDHKVNMDEAEAFANDVIDILDGDVATRAASSRKISSVVALSSSQNLSEAVTRAIDKETVEIPDTVAYLFNFVGDAGYAIISGDKRIQSPILAYCADGNLTEEIDNPGLIGALIDTEGYIINSIIDYENRIDSIKNDILEKLLPESSVDTKAVSPLDDNGPVYRRPTYDVDVSIIDDPGTTPIVSNMVTTSTTTHGGWETTEIVQPLLPVEWTQWFPFNKIVKTKGGCANAPAGCVAVALGQIMAYWGYPTSIYNYRFDWELLRSYTARVDAYPNASNKNLYQWDEEYYNYLLGSENNGVTVDEQNFVAQASKLMEIIGMGVGMSYSDAASSAASVDAMNFLTSYGYNVGDYLIDYNYDKVIQSLNNRRPVYARGNSKKTTHHIKILGITVGTSSEYGEGHAWIIDGYLNQRQAKTVRITVTNRFTREIVSQTTTTTYSYVKYLHHNWGWGAKDNGYFLAGSYNANDKKLESNTRATVTYEENNYRFLQEIVSNIRPE